MKRYNRENSIILIGQKWEVLTALKQAAKTFDTVAAWHSAWKPVEKNSPPLKRIK
ncbi:Z-ring formation inhibitor MciZ [Shouchella clausii]|jgi:hypothetical protein|uniref:Z-ring formation inhibitor MciZ n=1 Tax=Shouchella TaxID=2893057 RepID=UPI0004E60A21|nr:MULTISPECIES: Z-ring formation inhibitor MciZ [Shouchella]MCM3312550.1 Z-ring formation inhibitor MciZ [Psychrobacillus sp. MER TA 17]ALA51046.1 hypothetical protein DB29_00218 [Shouchella clausii]MBU3231844.1 Z-ring formation inhibitor MciZ [Shouchella clausii]MBU3264872.1 Z-ring formation inhibitor MciZ [Shouchella clausii]MBU3507665.1 Z-ring formation inhibitor MciZ [Shouchella clausii]